MSGKGAPLGPHYLLPAFKALLHDAIPLAQRKAGKKRKQNKQKTTFLFRKAFFFF